MLISFTRMDCFRENLREVMRQPNYSARRIEAAMRKRGLKINRNKIGAWATGIGDKWPNLMELYALAEVVKVPVPKLIGDDLSEVRRTSRENKIIRLALAVGYEKAERLLYDAIPKPEGPDPRFLPPDDAEADTG